MNIGFFVKRRWVTLIIVFAAIFLTMHKYISDKKVFYKAEALLIFRGNRVSFSPEAAIKILKEEDFLKKAAKKIPEVNKTILKKELQLKLDGDDLLSISLTLQDPQVAKDCVNIVSTLFVDERLEKVKSFKQENAKNLSSLSNNIERLQHEVAASQRSLRNQKEGNIEHDKRRAELQNRLNELEIEKADLLKVFTHQHPDVVTISGSMEILSSQLSQAPDNSSKYDALEAQIENSKMRLSQKQREYQQLYDSYSKMQEPWRVELREEAALPFQPIGRKRSWYYSWGLPIAFLMSILAAFVLELIDRKVYTKEEAQKRLKVPVIAQINKVILINKKNGQRLKKQLLLPTKSFTQTTKRFEQLYTFLKVDTFKGDIDKKSILVTSADKKTGKSFVAANLALAAAKNGNKVLLVDANFRFPAMDMVFNFQKESKGLTDLLRGNAKHKDVVRNLTDLLLAGSLKLKEDQLKGLDNLKILLPGSKIENPLGILGAKELGALFKELSQAYGLLIIEGPAIGNYPDTLNMVSCIDSLLLVARRKKTSYPLLNSVIAQTKKIDGPLAGLVLTHV